MKYSQLRAMFAITRASFRSITRSPSAIVFTLLFPLIFIIVFGFIVKDMLPEKGRRAIEEQGLYLIDGDGDWVTPLVAEGQECAYTIFENGIAKCSIEKAYLEGKTNFRKPVSCHLYPVRITKYKTYDAVNYEYWKNCAPACKLGASLQIPVYRFLKDSLTRKDIKTNTFKLENGSSGSR